MEIQLHGRLVSCTPEEYKRLIELNLIKVPILNHPTSTLTSKPNKEAK